MAGAVVSDSACHSFVCSGGRFEHMLTDAGPALNGSAMAIHSDSGSQPTVLGVLREMLRGCASQGSCGHIPLCPSLCPTQGGARVKGPRWECAPLGHAPSTGCLALPRLTLCASMSVPELGSAQLVHELRLDDNKAAFLNSGSLVIPSESGFMCGKEVDRTQLYCPPPVSEEAADSIICPGAKKTGLRLPVPSAQASKPQRPSDAQNWRPPNQTEPQQQQGFAWFHEALRDLESQRDIMASPTSMCADLEGTEEERHELMSGERTTLRPFQESVVSPRPPKLKEPDVAPELEEALSGTQGTRQILPTKVDMAPLSATRVPQPSKSPRGEHLKLGFSPRGASSPTGRYNGIGPSGRDGPPEEQPRATSPCRMARLQGPFAANPNSLQAHKEPENVVTEELADAEGLPKRPQVAAQPLIFESHEDNADLHVPTFPLPHAEDIEGILVSPDSKRRTSDLERDIDSEDGSARRTKAVRFNVPLSKDDLSTPLDERLDALEDAHGQGENRVCSDTISCTVPRGCNVCETEARSIHSGVVRNEQDNVMWHLLPDASPPRRRGWGSRNSSRSASPKSPGSSPMGRIAAVNFRFP